MAAEQTGAYACGILIVNLLSILIDFLPYFTRVVSSKCEEMATLINLKQTELLYNQTIVTFSTSGGCLDFLKETDEARCVAGRDLLSMELIYLFCQIEKSK